ncbi:hypothetical protein GGR54DRAFT_603250 [Hypoxylon sp. NC1633]|nr:hypothetical protein GGR54DRAFT_603250 [Hypoxylon sp. NC1633]
MSYASRNNSTVSLMGFSVHQPAIGAALQFFPAMGSKQLDEMIDAYVTGNASMPEKRAAVSLEFFEHTMMTGELFKFFLVYPSLGSTTESPAGSMVDSGYASNFTSPVMSESQWTSGSSVSHLPTESKTLKPSSSSSSKKVVPSTDFSHLPGMKILTRDGRDITNSASRGCKTKEQRDHAHLMRIIKACDSCRRKKIRCDPSHRRSTGSSATKATKKAKKAAAVSAPPSAPARSALEPSLFASPSSSSFDFTNPMSSSSFDAVMPESLGDQSIDWDQFFQYDEEPTDATPYGSNFFFDPAGHLSRVSSYSNSLSSAQPVTPAQILGLENVVTSTSEGEAQARLPPYLNTGGEAGSNYADFNLYSPGSSAYLDDDPNLALEVATPSRPDHTRYLDYRLLHDGLSQVMPIGRDRNLDTQPLVIADELFQASQFGQEQGPSPAYPETSPYFERLPHELTQPSNTASGDNREIDQASEWSVPYSPTSLSLLSPLRADEPQLFSRHLNFLPNLPNDSSSTSQDVQPGLISSSAGDHTARSTLTSQESAIATAVAGDGSSDTTVTIPGVPREVPQGTHRASPLSRGTTYPILFTGTEPTMTRHHEPNSSKSCMICSTPSSVTSSSRPTGSEGVRVARTEVVRRQTLSRHTSTYALGLSDQHVVKPPYTVIASNPTLQHTLAEGIPKTDSSLGRVILSASSSEHGVGILFLGILLPVLAKVALQFLSFLLLVKASSGENTLAKHNSFDVGALTVAQRGAGADGRNMLRVAVYAVFLLSLTHFGIAAPKRSLASECRLLSNKAGGPGAVPASKSEPSSPLRGLAVAVTSEANSGYSQLSRALSRLHCDL